MTATQTAAPASTMRGRPLRTLVALCCALIGAGQARTVQAQATSPTTISVNGGAQPAAQTAPTGQVQFGIRVPLKPNAENVLSVTAVDQAGQTATVNNLKIAQITLTDVVRAKVTATRLSTPEVKQLVAQGVIDVADPANYNVSRFVVVLTVGGQQVQVPVPVVSRIDQEFAEGPPVTIGCGSSLSTTDRAISIPCGGGGGGGAAQDTPPLKLIPFEMAAPAPGLPSIPGVIIIEGRIKTLKEFFKVDLLLMNVSSLFTLTELTARLDVPAGDVSPVAPAGGSIVMPDLAPGTDTTGNFIVRGDTKGIHTVTAHFGGKIVGSFLPAPVAFSGSASTDLEVRGAPKLDVRVAHPDFVVAGQPYDLTVTIENTDPELDALYASMALDVGAGADLLDETTGQLIDGPVSRNLGDILKGQSLTQTYKVMPLTSGAIVSCVGAADANINLSVAFLGNGPSCAIGTLPSQRVNPDGKPTVTVVPAHNTTGVSPATAIVALFSDQMITPTITAGYAGAAFIVESAAGVVDGTLTFADVFGGTSAIFQPRVPLAPDTTYTITVNPSVFNTAGLSLASGLVARFTTAPAAPVPDTTAPTVALAVEAPYTAAAVSRGQSVPVAAQVADAQGVTRVDVYVDGQLVDARKGTAQQRYLIETATMAAGTTHLVEARAFDAAGNVGSGTLSLQVAPDLQPPTVALVASAAVGQGRTLNVLAQATDDSRVARVDLYLDGAIAPLASQLVEPFSFDVDTTTLTAGSHQLVAVATDGAGNQAQTTATFSVTADTVPPQLALVSPQATRFRAGAPVAFAAQAVDDTAVAAITYTLDAEAVPRGTGESFSLATTGLTVGTHVMTIVAADTSNNRTTITFSLDLANLPVDTTPPPPVNAALVTLSTVSPGIIAVTGAAGAAEAGARVVVTNQTSQAGGTGVASLTGAFATQVDAGGGDVLSIVAIDDSGNISTPVTITVPVPATLVSLVVTPSNIALTRTHTSEQLGIVGVFSDNTQQILTGGLTFTSSAPSVASATTGGLVLPGQNGSAIITVSASVPGVAPVAVPVSVNFTTVLGLSASPSPLTLAGIGQSRRLDLTATFSDSTTGPFNGAVRFGTANPAIAIVDGSGLVTATGIGTTTISVASTGLPTVQVLVTVSPVQVTGLVVTPTSLSLTTLGQSQSLAVQFQYSDGTTGAGTAPVTYQSLDAAVASVSAAGAVTATGEGLTSIVVSSSGFVVNVAVTVTLPTTQPPPVITSLGRPIAGEGDSLVVLGQNFAGTPAQNFATVNGLRASVIGAADDRLIVKVPDGATTGPVQVRVAGQSSNTVTLDVYARLARTLINATPFQASPGVGQSVSIGNATFPLQPGDSVVVAGDPNTIVGATWSGLVAPVVSGRLVLTVNGVDVTLTPGGQPIDVTSYMPPVTQPTSVTVGLRVEQTAGAVSAGPLALIAGPPNTGVFTGLRYTTGNTLGEQTVVRFRTAAADGSKFAVTSNDWYRLDGAFGNGSTGGGSFIGSSATPNDGSFRTYTAQGGEVVVTFDDGGLFADFASPRQVVIAMVPADANGSRTTHVPIAEARIALTALDSATVAPQQTTILADGVNRPVAVDVNSVRDNLGNLVPDGTNIAVTVADWYRRSDGGFGNGSAGGALSGGVPSPNDGSFHATTLTGGAGQLVYTVNGGTLGAPATDTVVFAAVTGFPNGSRAGVRPFAEGTLKRSAPSVAGGSAVAVPPTLSAVSSDNRSVITLTGLTDAFGHLVPDGTMVAVTANTWYRQSDGAFGNGSFGGTIVGGITSPNDQSFRAFPVQGGSVTFTYSNAGLVLDDSATATTVVAVLPAVGNGSRIGSTPLAEVRIPQGGLTSATVVATPASTLADGARRPVNVAITNLRDALGNLVPDGTSVALTAVDWYRPDGNFGNGSAGGIFLDGITAPNDQSFRTFTVVNGRIDATYSPETVSPFGPNDFRSAVISVVVANGVGSRTTVMPFVTGTVALSSTQVGQISASPISLYTDAQSRTSTITLTGLTDAQGVPVSDGTLLAFTPANWYRPDGNFGNGSSGGQMVGGAATPNDGSFRTFSVSNGATTATYSNGGLFVDVGTTATSVISVLPAVPTGSRVGVLPIITTAVTLAGADTGTVVGPATVAPGGSISLTLTNLRDTSGNLIPDGAMVAVSAGNWYDRAGNFGNGSAGGTIVGGTSTPNDGSFRSFVVSGGQVTFTFTATSPANTTAVISVLPANGVGSRLAVRPFITHAVRVQ